MQNQEPQAPTPAQRPTFVFQGPAGTEPVTVQPPRPAREIQARQAQREELSNQLTSVDSRRKKLMEQLRQTGDPTATKGLQDRLALLDSRQLQLETDLTQNGQKLSS